MDFRSLFSSHDHPFIEKLFGNHVFGLSCSRATLQQQSHFRARLTRWNTLLNQRLFFSIFLVFPEIPVSEAEKRTKTSNITQRLKAQPQKLFIPQLQLGQCKIFSTSEFVWIDSLHFVMSKSSSSLQMHSYSSLLTFERKQPAQENRSRFSLYRVLVCVEHNRLRFLTA